MARRPAQDPAHAPASRAFPLGAVVDPWGVNFSVFSHHAKAMELLLYDQVDAADAARVIALDPDVDRTGDYWHVRVPGLAAGQMYAWRARGAPGAVDGHRFDGDKILLDPYGRAVAVPAGYSRAAAARPGANHAQACKSVVADAGSYAWEGDRPLRRPFAQTVIYEMHVRGFTRHASSGVAADRRGTFLGLVEKIPHLVDLGVTAVELMPVFQFDPLDAPAGLTNYWGYSPISFFAPHGGYAVAPGPLAVLDEFRDMVKALHRAGIEVILDVVFNHTAEGGEGGPTFCLRGLDDAVYYLHDAGGGYANYSGTGNTLNSNHAVVRRLVADSLHYWVEAMHVDGFRFDLAAVLSRDEHGVPMGDPPVLWDIATDPRLAGTKLIAEAWDAGGLYEVGNFSGDRWKEWNGRFRDDVRSFVRGDEGTVPALANRLLGSPDVYGSRPREAAQSVNFVTCHDGFTLADLVSYDFKHNEANGESNRDGSDDNRSWNCGVEGPTDDPGVLALRSRQVRNLLAATVLSLGTPMLLMGDEMGRSQGGNNNAYCQDDETTWLDWGLLECQGDLVRFVKGLIALRFLRESVRLEPHLTLAELTQDAHVRLHGVRLDAPDMSVPSHSLALTASSLAGDLLMHFALNAWWQPLDFETPPLPDGADGADGGWRRVIDTSQPPPADLCEPGAAPRVTGATHRVEPRSVVVLYAGRSPNGVAAGQAARTPRD
jgi:glycogen operon protein